MQSLMPEPSVHVAAQPAELADLRGSGYLVVRDDGYRRCEGTFFCLKAHRDAITALLHRQRTTSFRGIVYASETDFGVQLVSVVVQAFKTEPQGLVVHLRAVGAWWESLGRM